MYKKLILLILNVCIVTSNYVCSQSSDAFKLQDDGDHSKFIETTVKKNALLLDINPPYEPQEPQIKIKKGTVVKVFEWDESGYKYLIDYEGRTGAIKSYLLSHNEELDNFRDYCIKKKEEIAEADQNRKEYLELIKKADKEYNNKNYKAASDYYLEASLIFNESEYAEDMLAKIQHVTIVSDYNKHILDGDSLFQAGRYYLASNEYKKAMQIKPSDEIKGKLEIAESKFSEAVKRNKTKREADEAKKQADRKKALEEAQRKLDKLNQELKKKLILRYGNNVANRIMNKQIWLGMTSEMARLSLGTPTDINKTVNAFGTREQWVYRYNKYEYLYFENGILTSWQE